MNEVGTIAKFTIATFWQRVYINIVDGIFLFIVVHYVMSFFEKLSIEHVTVMPLIVGWSVFILALAGILSRWGGTPGCFVFQFRVKNSHDNFLTFWAALLRFLPVIVAVFFKILLFHGFILNLPKDALFLDAGSRIELMSLYHGTLYAIERIWSQFYWVDLGFILVNSAHRRSAVDVISGAYVVLKSDKESFER